MKLINHIDTVTDWEYDGQVIWFLNNYSNVSKSKICIHRLSHQDLTLDSVQKLVSKDEKYLLFIKGNENHKNFDFLYEDPNLLGIIKNYPALENQSKDGNQSYKMQTYNNKPFYPVIKEDERTLNLPLGFCNGFVPFPRKQRNINRFFWGQVTDLRKEWLELQHKIEMFTDNDIIGHYKGFGGIEDEHLNPNALKKDEYSRTMGNSNIALCPSGQSPETYRISEATASGCVIIGDILPAIDYYIELPYFIISPGAYKKSDEEMIPFLKNNLNKIKTYHSELSNSSLDWYNKWVEPRSVAKRIQEHLRRINVT